MRLNIAKINFALSSAFIIFAPLFVEKLINKK